MFSESPELPERKALSAIRAFISNAMLLVKRDLLDAPLVPSSLKFRGHPFVEDGGGHPVGDETGRHHKHVGVVVRLGETGEFRSPAEGRAGRSDVCSASSRFRCLNRRRRLQGQPLRCRWPIRGRGRSRSSRSCPLNMFHNPQPRGLFSEAGPRSSACTRIQRGRWLHQIS